jgi:hypothetical protein
VSAPNRIKLHFDGGTAEIYGDIMADMLACYANRLHDRKKEAHVKVAAIKLFDDTRNFLFQQAAAEFDDATSRLEIVDQIEQVFKNRAVEIKHYTQPSPRE